MTNSGTSRVARLDQLLDAALELEGAERARFLASDAVDAELRDELVELLKAAGEINPLDRTNADLHTAAAELFGNAAATPASAGQRIGRYRLLRQLGEGGTATVWLAERDDDTFDHQVAVKCLKTGLVTVEQRARFLREQQILAHLQHPQIARLYDAGISSEGVPFIVMEWVDGFSLTDYCDQHELGIAQRLRLFQKVCSAVAYAHQNLVVHRDLKPGNIVVGADGEPKLLDFGIAKLLDDSIEPMTRTGVRMFTPDYAAPEQFTGAAITTATDVYALGVILYELLSGLRPRLTSALPRHPGSSLATAPSEALRRLSGSSLRVEAGTKADSTSIAHARASTPDRLRAGLRGDLDTIVLKASQEEPDRRYPTVAALSEDIQRYLQQLPIRARPDSLHYRAQKFIRRNMLVAVAALAVTLALIAGLVASVWQARIAEHERQRAEQERAQAEQRFEDVRGLAHAMIFDLHDELVSLPGSTPARSVLVKQALTYLQRLGEQRDASIPLRRELAEAWLRVGDVQGAPGTPNLGDTQGALASYSQADARVDSILRATPGDPAVRLLQAQILLHRADVQYNVESLAGAEANYHRDIALFAQLQKEGLPEAGRGLARAQMGLANVVFWEGRHEESLKLFERAQATMEAAGPGKVATTYELFLGKAEVSRGDTLDWLGRHDEAATLLKHGLDRLQALQRSRPDDPDITAAVADASMRFGDNMFLAKDKTPMLAAYETARAAFAKMVAADPADMRARRGLALCETEVGDALVALKRYDEAMQIYQVALQAQQGILAREPRNDTVLQDMGNTWYGIGGVYQVRGRHDEAVAPFKQALAIRQALLASDPTAAAQRDVAQVLGDLAGEQTYRPDSCRSWLASAAAWQKLATAGNVDPTDQSDIAKVRRHAAACR